MTEAFPRWVVDAAELPVAFAQVREDPLLDEWVVEQIGSGARVLQVASGGCTAAYLAANANVAAIHLVDPNPAQLALTRLKLHLLHTASTADRLALLGHATMPVSDRAERLRTAFGALELPDNALGPLDCVASHGPDYAGRYECVFAELREALDSSSRSLERVLLSPTPVELPSALSREIDLAFDRVLSLDNLVCLFGAEATNNPAEAFSRHFARRLRHVVSTLPAATNPYLWQMMAGCFPDGHIYPWLTSPPPSRSPEVTWSNRFMIDVLKDFTNSFDFVHLSNILDWLTPERAAQTLEVAFRALRPGGWTLIRQLNSTLDIPSLGPMWEWLPEVADNLHARDRSFFYRSLHVGRKR